MAKPPLIWLTRPREDSEQLAALLHQQHIATVTSPVMRIEYLTPALAVDSTPQALLITSRHATHYLPHLPAAWRSLPVFCVGTATAKAVKQQGFGAILHVEPEAMALLPKITAHLPAPATLLYLAGDITRGDIVSLLAGQHITTIKTTVYTAQAEAALTPDLRDHLTQQTLTGTAFFSPRSAQLAHGLLMQGGFTSQVAQCDAYCLSLAVAEVAAHLPWRSLQVCHVPTLRAMHDLIVSRCANTVL